jgi:hypothetical protein
VARSCNAVALRDAQVEVVALYIYELAYHTTEVVTQRFVDRELVKLAGHPAGCRCPSPCELAREVRPSRVYRTARTWQNSITTKHVHGAH